MYFATLSINGENSTWHEKAIVKMGARARRRLSVAVSRTAKPAITRHRVAIGGLQSRKSQAASSTRDCDLERGNGGSGDVD